MAVDKARMEGVIMGKIADIIYENLYYMYCDNCRYNDEILEDENSYDPCEDCHRKYNGWGISREEAERIERLCQEAMEIGDMPETEVEPVKHGRCDNHICTNCNTPVDYFISGDVWIDRNPDYCPNCGVRIDGEG